MNVGYFLRPDVVQQNPERGETTGDAGGVPIASNTSPNQVCPPDSSELVLQPPTLSLPTPLVSNHQGEVRVSWKEVAYADHYVIRVTDSTGKIFKTYTTPYLTLYLKELPYNENSPFTSYKVSLATVNRKKIEGAFGPGHPIQVRPMRNLIAPTINEISVEQ